MEIGEVVRQRLLEGKMFQLATCVDNQSWCCTMFYVSDADLNIYWVSKPMTRHSKELKRNPKVAIAIPIKTPIDGKKVGLQAEGNAYVIEDKIVLEKAARLFAEKYQIKPKMWGVFDEENFPKMGRVDWKV